MSYVHPDIKVYVRHEISQSAKRTEDRAGRAGDEALRAALLRQPRRDKFALTNIAVGDQEVAVSWSVPIGGDYTVLVSKTCAAQFVGLLDWAVKAGTKTPTGATIIVANRALVSIGAATFDVLAFPH